MTWCAENSPSPHVLIAKNVRILSHVMGIPIPFQPFYLYYLVLFAFAVTIYRTKCMTLQECSAIACPIDLFSNLSSSTNMDNIEVIECEKDCCDGQGCNVSIDDRLQGVTLENIFIIL